MEIGQLGNWEKENYVRYRGIGKIVGNNSRNSNHSKNVLFKHLNLEEVIDRSTPANNSLLTGVLRPISPY